MNTRFRRKSPGNDGPMTRGGDVLRHALKNELAKISLCSRNIEASESKLDDETFRKNLRENAKNIQASTDYLLKLIKRIHDFAKDITLIEGSANLFEIIEDAINLALIYLQTKQINIKRNYSLAQMNFFCYVMRYT